MKFYSKNKMLLVMSFIIALSITSKIYTQELHWKHLGGPMGGAIGDIAINSKGHIYAGTYSSLFYYYAGLYKSTDNGDNWNKIQSLPYDIEVYALFINKDDHIFVGTRGLPVIYRSTDDGETWEIKNSGITSAHCWSFGQNKGGNVLFAGEAQFGRIYRSTNNGDNWQLVDNLSGISFAVDSLNNIYCGTFDGLYKSTDDGLTFTPTGLINVPVNAIQIDSSDGVIAGTGYYTNGQGVFYSTDFGNTFTSIGLGGQIIYSLAFTDYGSLLAGSSINGVYETTDMGGNWQQHNNGLYRKDIFRLKINHNGDIITGAEFEGIFRSKNKGESFEHIGLPISTVNNIVFYGDSLIISATPSGVQKYNRLTKEWNNVGLHKVNAVDIDEEGTIYAAVGDEFFGGGGGVFMLREFNGEWAQINNNPLVLNIKKVNQTILAATDTGLIRSINEGQTWEATPVRSGIDNCAIEVNNNGDIWVTGYVGKLYKSIDGGINFDSLSTLNFHYILRNGLYINDSSIFFGDITVGNGIFYSNDYGNSWQNTFFHRSVVCVKGTNNYIMFGSKDLLFTTNKGSTWDSIPYPSPYDFYGYVNEIEVDKKNQLFFGTSSHGLYEIDFVVDVKDYFPIIKDFVLYPLYPNPFNPAVNVKYNLPKVSEVKLSVFNILGQKIKEIELYRKAGINEEKISFDNLAGGIYIISIEGKDFYAVQKAVFLK
ncbi:MAG: T9SS type A sorting domain-containing protein [Ignavibacterium sp.]|nr:T9SS type A sorting domain-containing protein [Ignavibacterium sp.]